VLITAASARWKCRHEERSELRGSAATFRDAGPVQQPRALRPGRHPAALGHGGPAGGAGGPRRRYRSPCQGSRREHEPRPEATPAMLVRMRCRSLVHGVLRGGKPTLFCSVASPVDLDQVRVSPARPFRRTAFLDCVPVWMARPRQLVNALARSVAAACRDALERIGRLRCCRSRCTFGAYCLPVARGTRPVARIAAALWGEAR